VFQYQIKEGNLYDMSFFDVLPNDGGVRVTYHSYRLVFQFRTCVVSVGPNGVPINLLSTINSEQVLKIKDPCKNLIGELSLF
jgi:hypothetical protein